MKLCALSLFAFASRFSIPFKLFINPTTLVHRKYIHHYILSNHYHRETKLFYAKVPQLNRNESRVQDADAFMLHQALIPDVDIEMPGSPTFLINEEADALFATLDPEGKVHHIAVNLAIHEEMLRDPTTTLQAEDLQAGSSYGIPRITQQTYGSMRASDEIIDEGHFIGKSIGEAMNGYRPIVELMNTNCGIYYGRDSLMRKHIFAEWWPVQTSTNNTGRRRDSA